MTLNTAANPLSMYLGADGKPINNGKIYYGLVNQNPVTNPVTVYWDDDGTQPAIQPIKISGCYPVRAGTPARVYVAADSYSISVYDKKGALVFTQADATSSSTLGTDLSASSGSSLVGFIQSGAGAVVRTVQDKLRERRSVADYGAVGVGTDYTVAIQAALTAAGVNGAVYIPSGTYLVSGTLYAPNGCRIYGEGWAQTKLLRTGDYGDTIQFGTSASAGGAACLSGIGIFHSTSYVTGDSVLANRATSGTHVRLWGTQGALIENCWFFRLPYCIVVEGGSVGTIRDCAFQGTWDHTVAALQEGIAQVYLRPNATFGNPTTWTIENTRFNGCNVLARNVSLTSGDGTVIKSMTELIGSKYGVLIEGAEDFQMEGCYLGGMNFHCVSYNISATGNVIDNRILNCHFDGGRFAQVSFDSASAGKYALGVQITSNTFNNELLCKNTLIVGNASSTTLPSLVNFTFTGNTSFQSYGSGIVITAAWGGLIKGNTISSYNTLNASTTDAQWVAGVLIDTANSKNIEVEGNIVGGGGNAFDQNTGNTYTYQDITIGAACVNVNARSNQMVGIRRGSNFAVGSAQTPNQYGATAAANYQMKSNEDIYIRNYAAVASNVCALPQYPPTGKEVVVKDGFGNAGTWTIIVQTSDTTQIDGAASITVSTNYGFYKFRFNGTQWNRIG